MDNPCKSSFLQRVNDFHGWDYVEDAPERLLHHIQMANAVVSHNAKGRTKKGWMTTEIIIITIILFEI